MRFSQKNKIKAFILLAVFSLNTLIGFACSVGLNMGFNKKHHDEGTIESTVHIHTDGKKHIHYEKSANSNSKSHEHGPAKHHEDTKDGKDNCCNDKVQKFEQIDKSLPQSFNIIYPNFLIIFFDAFISVSLPSSDIIKDIKQFVRSYHPPIPDIRIAIQSFQI